MERETHNDVDTAERKDVTKRDDEPVGGLANDEGRMETREVERLGVKLNYVDLRSDPDEAQAREFRSRLERDGALDTLSSLADVLGDFCNPEREVTLELCDAILLNKGRSSGSGEALGNVAKVGFGPEAEEVAEAVKRLQRIDPEATEAQARDLLYDIKASVALHEMVHALIESKPGSALHGRLAEEAGIDDADATFSTVCDEGLAYGIQGLRAGENQFLGSLAPRIAGSDSVYSKQGKMIGERLRPTLQAMIDGKSVTRDAFIREIAAVTKRVIEEVAAQETNNQ